MESLEQLTLRGSIGSVQFDAFTGMEKLRELDLSQCGIVELSMDALMGLKSLKTLILSHNNLTQLPNGLLDEQQQLEMVQLQGNQLKALPTSFFQQRRLRVVRLDQNPWQCSCDMAHWQPKLTNAVRIPSVKQCVRDINGEEVSCRHVVAYEMDKSLVPRCANYNGRSVYYVMRKQLHCGAMAILHTKRGTSTRGLPHWQKLEMQRKSGGGKRRHNRKHHVQRNHVDYVLRKQQQQHQQQNEATMPDMLDQEMSNEI